ncbi:MAG: NAD(P)/FAD-dependent oxidoreductase [Rubrivivax sp.]|nr:NAD(P)/FAD-dependent oxidoreductase [Rubrivivax sp.]
MLDILIVGAGFSGLSLALAAQRGGYRWHLLEQASSLGGTWRDNRYPGACCDVPSNLYSLSAMPNPEWTRLYPPQAEIEAYMNRCADAGGLRPGMSFNAAVRSARWLPQEQAWEVHTADGGRHRARLLALGTGGLSRPRMPAVTDLDRFAGPLFHSAGWRADVPLAGRRVGLIGTGASAIQIVPAIADEVTANGGRLLLFQRTPAWIMPRRDHAISERRRELYRRHPWRQRWNRSLTYALLEWRAWPFTRAPGLLQLASHEALRHLQRQIPDAALRRQLRPDYTMGCKRVLLSDDFYPALLKPGVSLVNQAVVRATPEGVITADGRSHALDVLIAASGFQVADAGAPFEITGAQGCTLDEAWGTRPQAHLGTMVQGFPNLFLMTGPNTGLGHNSMIVMIEAQTRFVQAALKALRSGRIGRLEPTAQAQQRYNAQIQAALAQTVWNRGGCRSWYLDADGHNHTLWPDFTFRFRQQLARIHWPDFETAPGHAVAAGPDFAARSARR